MDVLTNLMLQSARVDSVGTCKAKRPEPLCCVLLLVQPNAVLSIHNVHIQTVNEVDLCPSGVDRI